jgi:hypothetical protein
LKGNLIRVAAEASPSTRPAPSRQLIHGWVRRHGEALGVADHVRLGREEVAPLADAGQRPAENAAEL